MGLRGATNPNWRGGLIAKSCAVCEKLFHVKRANASARYCSLKCVGVSQRGRTLPKRRRIEKNCVVCGDRFELYASHVERRHSCSSVCYRALRSRLVSGERNGTWKGGLSRLPYPYDFAKISRVIIERDGGECQNPECAGTDARMTTHHINYEKQDCRDENLIALCSACNSKANFGRDRWQQFYSELIAARVRPKKDGGGFAVESFG